MIDQTLYAAFFQLFAAPPGSRLAVGGPLNLSGGRRMGRRWHFDLARAGDQLVLEGDAQGGQVWLELAVPSVRGGGGGGPQIANLGANPSQIDIGDTAQVGVSNFAARADHQHAMPVPPAPAVVTSDLSLAGTSQRAARADHEHRLEINVSEDGSPIAADGRPRLNFIGALAVDNNADDRIDITIPAAQPGIARGASAVFTAIAAGPMTSNLEVPFSIPQDQTWDIEVEASGTLLLDYPGDPDPVGIAVDYELFEANNSTVLSFSEGRVSITSTSDLVQDVSFHTLAWFNAAAGDYRVQLRAMASLIGGATTAIRTRRMSIRRFLPGV